LKTYHYVVAGVVAGGVCRPAAAAGQENNKLN